ncbi:DedA family protein [Novosphingobium arvoryzae]|uniref:Membrane protein n=1 Tax=Novosphingobium arvoryzae TaxID=1256514 RepID=A0A918REE2_9SPHN|nr:DedA family protein [Novosphingobium arvoryzae]GGZ95757.1 membrane protein [Novosphingobium arvoryzae]
MTEFIIRLIEQGGYLGIFVLMVVENIFPPIPSELIMGMGGVAVSRGSMAFWPLLVVGTLGSTLGNYVWYLAGEKLGYRRLKPLIDRWGRWLTVDWEDVEKGTAFFQRHGHWIVFALRFSPLLRTIISLPAGLIHMPRAKFLAFTLVGTAVWNTGLILGGQWAAGFFETSQAVAEWVVGGMLAATLIAYVYRVVTWKPRV